MNARDPQPLPDVQASTDHRHLPIQRVGVKGLRYPLSLAGADGTLHPTVATLNLTVRLPETAKGTHMSRFVELLEARRAPLSQQGLLQMLEEMLERLGADGGRIELVFPWFVRKAAPVSGVSSLLDCDASLVAERLPDALSRLVLQVRVPVTSLCPCSKEISEYGAHNQRSLVTIEAQLRAPVAIDELVRIAEQEASCEVFGLLKRPDERWVTERAYDNPKFVEDLVRDVALRLRDDRRIGAWKVCAENFESIHNHSAYAELWGSNE